MFRYSDGASHRGWGELIGLADGPAWRPRRAPSVRVATMTRGRYWTRVGPPGIGRHRLSNTGRQAMSGLLCLLFLLLLTGIATWLVSSRASKRWASWAELLCFTLLVFAIGLMDWAAAANAWVF